jgi:NADPH:quinone reductase-like Zn-dependent oxidoreductase
MGTQSEQCRKVSRTVMKAIRLHAQGGPEALVYEDAPEPRPQAGEVLIRVQATAITLTEFDWDPTWRTVSGAARSFPIILGHEFSGTIAAVGPGIAESFLCEAVYGINDWFGNGAQAEYCLAKPEEIAPKPRSLSHVEAAVVPISGLTAWQGLLERAQLKAGQSVLIHGAAGGVGVFDTQLAHWRGARVMATASAADLDFVRNLGAAEVIDYHAQRFEDVVREVDVVFDCVGGETLRRSWQVLKPGGKLVSISHLTEHAANQRDRDTFFIVQAYSWQLKEMGRLFDTGKIRPIVAALFPLAQARQAYERAGKGHLQGKVVLEIL